jgi:hypothetical protein
VGPYLEELVRSRFPGSNRQDGVDSRSRSRRAETLLRGTWRSARASAPLARRLWKSWRASVSRDRIDVAGSLRCKPPKQRTFLGERSSRTRACRSGGDLLRSCPLPRATYRLVRRSDRQTRPTCRRSRRPRGFAGRSRTLSRRCRLKWQVTRPRSWGSENVVACSGKWERRFRVGFARSRQRSRGSFLW